MALDEDPKNSISGSKVGGHAIFGSNNVINAAKDINDQGIFIPSGRNTLFTGREPALAALSALLRGEKIVVVTGMGGLGKSQLALEFAYRSTLADEFVSAHWLNLMDPNQIGSEIAKCGHEMGLLDDTAKQPDMLAATLGVWAKRGPRLLVLDNYESAADAMQRLAPLLALPTLRLLITARRADFPPELGPHPYPLTVFTPAESVEFVRKLVKLPESETPNIEKLAEKLGHLPLALHLAGHYLREEGITPTKYLSELDKILSHESMQAAWFAQMDIHSPTAHEQSLLGTFALSWQKVTDPTAQTVFKLAGYLAPNQPIPLEIFAAVLEVEEKDRGLRKALRLLVGKVGLFTSKDDLPVIHPLLGAYGRYLDGKSSELLEKLAGKLAVLAQKANKQVDQSGSLSWFVPLQVHIVIVAEYAEKRNLQTAGYLYGNLGYYLPEIADYIGARAAHEHAIRILEVHLGSNHPDIATAVNNLGLVLQYIGDYPAARNIFERAINIWKANFGEYHPQVATSVNNLGMVLWHMGDYHAAYNAIQQALHIDEVIFGLEDANVAIRVNNLGLVLQALGNYPAARSAFERALHIGETVFGKEHPKIAIRINNLGGVLRDMGDLNGAYSAFNRALKIDETFFGNDHPEVAIDVLNLGNILQALGKKKKARACYERALIIFEHFLPAGHPRIENAKGWLRSLDDFA